MKPATGLLGSYSLIKTLFNLNNQYDIKSYNLGNQYSSKLPELTLNQ